MVYNLSRCSFLQVQSDYMSAVSNSPLLSSSHPIPDSKFTRTSMSSPSGSARPPPPLPSTPPPFSSNPYNLSSLNASTSQLLAYNQNSIGTTELSHSPIAPAGGNFSASGAGYPPPPLMPPSVFGRPASIPVNPYGSTSAQLQGENPLLQNPSIPQSAFQLPLQQLQRPLQLPQQLRPPMQASQQLDQGVSLQTPVQMQMHPLQILQQPQVSGLHSYHQPQQQEFSSAQQQLQSELARPAQALRQQGSGALQQQEDSGMSLHEYFQSPEAIQVCDL